MDREAWRATDHEVTKSQTRLRRLSMHTCGFFVYQMACDNSRYFQNILIDFWKDLITKENMCIFLLHISGTKFGNGMEMRRQDFADLVPGV